MHPQQFTQTILHSLDPELTILTLLTTFTNIFTQFLPYNKKSQTKIFMFCLIGVFAILKMNEEVARTAVFLMRIVLGEIVVIGVFVRMRRYIGGFFGVGVGVGEKGREGLEWKCLYPIVIMVLVLFSIVGLVYAIHTDLYLQLLQFPQLPQMLTLITFGFIIVYLSDTIFKKLTKQKQASPNQINTIRRKIFHFVPVGLLPILSQISYRLFTLMVFGAFYLFWLVQVGRCFGKFGRMGDKKQEQKQKQDEQKQKMEIQQNSSKTRNQITKSSTFLKIIQLFHKLNIKISQLPFIKWMQQLNSSRQPYFWFTHLSLILGLSLTYIYYPPQSSTTSQIPTLLNQNMSIILIISDAMAAIIGRKYGKPSHRIPYTNKKTIEGYFGFVVTMVGLMLGCYFGSIWWYGVEGGVGVGVIGVVVVSGMMCGVGELFSGDLDNFVCVFVYIFVEWSYRKYLSWA